MKKIYILILIFLMAGCGQTPKEEAKNGIIVAIPQDFDSLDPHKATATGTQEIMYNIFTCLINTDENGEIIPELAESFESSDDLKTYTFKLKQDVIFHNGVKMTSKDVLYTFNRLSGKTQDQSEPISDISKNIDSVEAPDDYTIIIHLKEKDASFLAKCLIAIIPENSGPQQEKTPIGAGPYAFESYTQGISLKMKKNKDFYMNDLPKIENVEFKIFTNTSAGQLALKNGEIDIMFNLMEADVKAIGDGFDILRVPRNMVQLMAFNYDFAPFKDIRVRQAINYAVNKKEIIDLIVPGSVQIDTNFSPVMAGYYNKDVENFYQNDIEKAKTLLKESGNENLSFTVKVPSEYKQHVDTAQIIKQQLAQVGIEMNIETVEWNTWLSEVYKGKKFEATIIGFTGKLDPYPIIGRYASDYKDNFMSYSNPEFDEVIKKATAESDMQKRTEYYREAQMLLTQDAAALYIMDPSNIIAINKNLENFKTYPIGYIDIKNLSYKD